MKIGDAYPSKYVSAEDLNGQDIVVTITSAEIVELGQVDKESKLVLGLSGKTKKFVCNRTNSRTIEKVLGSDETNDWIGERIIIGPREVEGPRGMVMAIRVSLKPPGPVKTAAAHGIMGKPVNRPAAPVPEPEPEPEDQDGGNAGSELDVPF